MKSLFETASSVGEKAMLVPRRLLLGIHPSWQQHRVDTGHNPTLKDIIRITRPSLNSLITLLKEMLEEEVLSLQPFG